MCPSHRLPVTLAHCCSRQYVQTHTNDYIITVYDLGRANNSLKREEGMEKSKDEMERKNKETTATCDCSLAVASAPSREREKEDPIYLSNYMFCKSRASALYLALSQGCKNGLRGSLDAKYTLSGNAVSSSTSLTVSFLPLMTGPVFKVTTWRRS